MSKIPQSNQPTLFNEPATLFPKTEFLEFITSKLGDKAADLTDLAERLEWYEAPVTQVAEYNADRKWEIVSAIQKSIRRGNVAIALEMSATLLRADQEPLTTYLWRRIAVTAGEDIGLAEPELVAFVLLCNQFFTPKKFPTLQPKVLSFLTEELAQASKDRSLCDFSVISMWAKNGDPGGREGEEIIKQVRECDAIAKSCASNKDRKPYWVNYAGYTRLLNYLVEQDYRTEGMTKFVGLELQFMKGGTERQLCSPEYALVTRPPMLRGIPEYAYDMHTRVGKRALVRFSEYEKIKPYLPPGTERLGALGWALFYVEGGQLDRDVGYPKRDAIEQLSCRLALTAQGIAPEKVGDFLLVVRYSLPVLNGIRMAIVHEAYRAGYKTSDSGDKK